MTVNEIIYILAYCVFLVGAAKSFRENGREKIKPFIDIDKVIIEINL